MERTIKKLKAQAINLEQNIKATEGHCVEMGIRLGVLQQTIRDLCDEADDHNRSAASKNYADGEMSANPRGSGGNDPT